ncbi:related to Putative ribonuclease YLR143W [Saccharomycodes ludwigii]|uniref:Diphthine--ammonia ligase n=1 Tax=Saccharomycodes ludwigii TaxID=36035 RepID=A0A376B3X7_9ASCO|nr:hypothetical protein SCDLUD_001792 [Saccharomycodes ludwigii]KAH3902004.1 hypothetical protein SCDLUD_001792 [Saccharomycodes ludwigii]SSD59388.1 related to Putative ribonuclease YLR143W [Saccharomycodes ludwigii]
MKFVALVSGGKDSCFNIMHCLAQGHDLVALANLYPKDVNEQELDSFMFQTVGHDIVSYYNACTGLPLYRQELQKGTSLNVNMNYTTTKNDETEELYKLLQKIKTDIPDIQAVSVGAILSSYQRIRVENVCSRLNLTVLSYLWQRDQLELMSEMCEFSIKNNQNNINNDVMMDARIIKVAAIGLNQSHLGKSLPEVFPDLVKLNKKFDVHICGEGGEFETMVLDAPFFKNGFLQIENIDKSVNSSDGVANAKLTVKFIERKLDINEQIQLLKENLPKPTLLNEKWTALYDKVKTEGAVEIEKKDKILAISPPSSNITSPCVPIKTSINLCGERMYISNINPRNWEYGNLEEQVKDVFNQLDHILKKQRLSVTQFLSCSLVLKDMSTFTNVNRFYKNFFNISLPPSRACVASKLIKGRLQLSLIADLHTDAPIKDQEKTGIDHSDQMNEQLDRNKNGLHVQGISYWCPCNIGPYSQATWNQDLNNQLTYVSGQIPLIPSTMEIVNKRSGEYSSVVALRHFITLCETIGANKPIHMLCYVSCEEIVDIISKTWKLYCDEKAFSSDDEAIDIIKSLIIVKVSQLPRGAMCEWGGMTCRTYLADQELDVQLSKLDLLDNDPVASYEGKNDFFNINIKNSKYTNKFFTGFFDTETELRNFLLKLATFSFPHIKSRYQITMYFNPHFIMENDVFDPYNNIEYYPVESVYDYEGNQRKFGLFMSISY